MNDPLWVSLATLERPTLYTVAEVAGLMRTTRRAVYAMAERGKLPGVLRVGRRLLFNSATLLQWLDQKRAPSSRSER